MEQETQNTGVSFKRLAFYGAYISAFALFLGIVGIPIATCLQIITVLIAVIWVIPQIMNLFQQTRKPNIRLYKLVLGLLICGILIYMNLSIEHIHIRTELIVVLLGLFGIGLGLKET